jgi:hypothetical protein
VNWAADIKPGSSHAIICHVFSPSGSRGSRAVAVRRHRT